MLIDRVWEATRLAYPSLPEETEPCYRVFSRELPGPVWEAYKSWLIAFFDYKDQPTKENNLHQLKKLGCFLYSFDSEMQYKAESIIRGEIKC